jgi:hypothetical protein
MALQSNDEILRTVDDWYRHFRPPNMLNTERNAKALYDYCMEHSGVVTISTLTEAAYSVSAANLDLAPPPKTAEELKIEQAIKGEAKMRKDYLDSLKPQNAVEVAKAAQARLDKNGAEAQAKELASILASIESEIEGYTVNWVNGIDYTRTEEGRKTLREVRDQHSRRTIAEAKTALSPVRAAKMKLP